MNDFIPIRIYFEKIYGRGEDAEPLLEIFDKFGFLGVFDGLGGAGSTTYKENGAAYSGAYYASRIARQVIRDLLIRRPEIQQGDLDKITTFVSLLQNIIAQELQRKAIELDKNYYKLKSSLIKRLPTTIVVMCFWLSRDNSSYHCLSIWAGDSRGYFLTPDKGLCQITVDDLKSNGDALESLCNDSPLSNYANADTSFVLHHRLDNLNSPFVLITATDGCFSYVQTPMHFEFFLLETLMRAQTIVEWEQLLKDRLSSITGDDASMALIAIGWPDFNSFRRSFEKRYETILQDYISKLNNIDERIKFYERKLAQYKDIREEARGRLWLEYKKSYESLMRH